jgi:hypothetical protein
MPGEVLAGAAGEGGAAGDGGHAAAGVAVGGDRVCRGQDRRVGDHLVLTPVLLAQSQPDQPSCCWTAWTAWPTPRAGRRA